MMVYILKLSNKKTMQTTQQTTCFPCKHFRKKPRRGEVNRAGAKGGRRVGVPATHSDGPVCRLGPMQTLS